MEAAVPPVAEIAATVVAGAAVASLVAVHNVAALVPAVLALLAAVSQLVHVPPDHSEGVGVAAVLAAVAAVAAAVVTAAAAFVAAAATAVAAAAAVVAAAATVVAAAAAAAVVAAAAAVQLQPHVAVAVVAAHTPCICGMHPAMS